VEGTYHVLLIDKQSNEIERDYNKNIEEIQWEFEIDDAELHMGKSLYIESLDFDFSTKTCSVTFSS